MWRKLRDPRVLSRVGGWWGGLWERPCLPVLPPATWCAAGAAYAAQVLAGCGVRLCKPHAATRLPRRWPKFWLNVGCLAVFGQLAAMAYLTWWELSWDVMEPVAYHLTLLYGCFAYIYFLVTRGNYLDYGPFQE